MARAQALSLELSTRIAPGFEALAFKASRGIADSYELTYIRKDGSRFPAVVSITALRDDYGEVIGYLLIGADNTVRKRVESDLNQALAAAEKANLAKSDFLSGMSHELRTPLNAILGFAQLVESGSPVPTPAQRRNIDQILKAGWYLLELINEILDLSLIESGKLTLSAEPVSLVEVMLECRAMIEPQAQKRGISMRFPRFEIPHFVKADRTRVKQVLINLLFNAIKYNKPAGTVDVEYTLKPPHSIRICVRDTGAGLTAEQLAQLFQPFNRLGKEASAEEGTGIGLVMTKRLIELMGGAIGADSTVGVGSVFWVELGLTSAPQLAVLEAERAVLARPTDGTPLRTLLYVEDNPANLELVEQLVARRSDLRLLSAADGNMGVEYARAYQPDVILMDINLPGISGVEALRILRADPSTAHIPVIALSANAIPRDIDRGLEAGFFNYLTKPIKVNQFMDALDVALKFSQTEKERA
jgi:signal transduction histidine kinase/ActR/RegA family two-component response regulator